jgi:hypothetical protein
VALAEQADPANDDDENTGGGEYAASHVPGHSGTTEYRNDAAPGSSEDCSQGQEE